MPLACWAVLGHHQAPSLGTAHGHRRALVRMLAVVGCWTVMVLLYLRAVTVVP